MIDLIKLKKDIAYLTISDIHFFHDQNESAYIAGSMMEFMDGFSSKSKFKDLDVIFLDGDILDTYRDSKHPDMIIVLNWMRLMMGFCVKHGIKLRVLEGTPGHDYKQSKNFTPIADAYGEALDYKYIEVLSFEKMEDLGITILYVPDEWAGSAAACKAQVIEMMERNGIEKFDIAHMHGMFDFQIPDLGEHPLKHDSAWYHEIVRSYINIGHDHGFKTHSRILVQGSFDRIAHGEEGKKGAILCKLRKDGKHSFDFIENKRARTFKTIVVKTQDLDKGIAQITDVLVKLPENSHVRISTGDNNPILGVIDEFKRAHPRMKFKKHKDKKQSVDNKNVLQETVGLASTYVAISLTQDNIIHQILENFPSALDPSEVDVFRDELEAIL